MYLYDLKIVSLKDAKKHLKRVIELYNQDRPHLSIGYLTPEVVHQNDVVTENLWEKNGLK